MSEIRGQIASDQERRNLQWWQDRANALERVLRRAVEQCACSPAERHSGHLLGCFAFEAEAVLDPEKWESDEDEDSCCPWPDTNRCCKEYRAQ